MGRLATDPGLESYEGPPQERRFLWLSMEAWVKIMLGWLTASLIGIAGWFLYVRDSIADRPTNDVMDRKIETATKEALSVLLKHDALLDRHSDDIKDMQIGASAYVEIHRAQNKILDQQTVQLNSIQSDIKKLLYEARKGD